MFKNRQRCHLSTWLGENEKIAVEYHEFESDACGTIFGKVGCEIGGVSCRQIGDEWEQLSDVGECFPNEWHDRWFECSDEHCSQCCDCIKPTA